MFPWKGHKLELEGVPKPQAQPRLGRCGFCNPGSKGMVTFKARIKNGILGAPVFGANQPVVVNIKFFMKRWRCSKCSGCSRL